MRIDRKRIAGLVAAVAASTVSIIAAARFQREPPLAEEPAPGMTVGKQDVLLATDAPQWKVLRLGAARPAEAHYTERLPARIQLDEAKVSRVGTPLAGRVSQVFVERGQSVKAGQILFTVVSPNVAELRAQREKAQVDLEVARTNRERVKTVVDAHAAAAKDLVASDQELHQAEVALKLAEAKLATLRGAKVEGNELTVTTPREGVVVEKSVSVAQNVSPDASDPLIIVADLSTVWVVADLFEADATQLTQGAPAKVTSPSLPRSEIDGKVDQVSSVVDPTRHTIPIRVKLDNPDKSLRPNVYAQMRILAGATPNAVEIAASAVMTDGRQSYVYVQAAQGRFAKRIVVTGSARDGRVPILQGLELGETVVEEGGVLLDNQIDLSN